MMSGKFGQVKRPRMATTQKRIRDLRPGVCKDIQFSGTVVEKTDGGNGAADHYNLVVFMDAGSYIPVWFRDGNLERFGPMLDVGKRYALTIRDGSIAGGGKILGDKYYVPSLAVRDLDVAVVDGSMEKDTLTKIMDTKVKLYVPSAYAFVGATFVDLQQPVEIAHKCPDCDAAMEFDMDEPDEWFCKACNANKAGGNAKLGYRPVKIVLSDGMIDISVTVFDTVFASLFGPATAYDETGKSIVNFMQGKTGDWLLKKRYSRYQNTATESYILCHAVLPQMPAPEERKIPDRPADEKEQGSDGIHAMSVNGGNEDDDAGGMDGDLDASMCTLKDLSDQDSEGDI